jgi:hypothetical protein
MLENDKADFAIQTTTSPPAKSTSTKGKFDYREQLKQDFGNIFNSLETLTPLQKEFLKSRWLDQLLWMEGRATQARNWYHRLRMITIIGGVLVPALISLSTIPTNATVSTNNSVAIGSTASQGLFRLPANSQQVFALAAFFISQGVAISAAVEQFFNYGERWRNYRRSAELLKSQGWQFFQLSGAYAAFAKGSSHCEAFPIFAAHVEEIIRSDVEIFVTQVIEERKQKQDGEEER